ncbi:MAG: cytochrome c biogenesis protein CcsA [Burkholderiales bacterium]|nr:cytochrome c biogenesis protein CcsA [Burkholderiales bacterium]
MTPPILAYLATALGYGALAAYFWRTRWAHPIQAASDKAAGTGAWEQVAVLAPLTLHAVLLYQSTLAGPEVRLGIGIAASLIVWLSVLIYWFGSFIYHVQGLQALVMPIAAIGCLVPLVAPGARTLPNAQLLAFKAHLLISMLAYGFFTIASLHVLLMAVLEKRLHGGQLRPALTRLPPLLTMERILFQLIGAGFVLLTLSLASGIVFSEEVFGKPLSPNHKTVFGVLSWMIFGALLWGRRRYGWRGRVAMRWTLTGFLMLVLAYFGSRFVLEVVLQRTA